MKFSAATVVVLASASASLASWYQPKYTVKKAIVAFNGPIVNGSVIFEQDTAWGPVKVIGYLTGLNASTEHGMHVHQYGNLTGGCASAGAHFNPYNVTHGDRLSPNRHVGDLGNIKTDASGVANFTFEDKIISLSGNERDILGRVLVIHAMTDDYGKGNNTDTHITGNAGARLSCGIIGVAA